MVDTGTRVGRAPVRTKTERRAPLQETRDAVAERRPPLGLEHLLRRLVLRTTPGLVFCSANGGGEFICGTAATSIRGGGGAGGALGYE